MDMLNSLAHRRTSRARRASSWDRAGKNADRTVIPSGDTALLADIAGSGTIRHIWMTARSSDPFWLRKVLLRAYWDQEEEPSILAPMGDFFACGHSRLAKTISLPIVVIPSPGMGSGGMNCYFAMPFARGARLEIVNECNAPLIFYFHIDYEEHPGPPEEPFRFHVQWRRVNPTPPPDPITPVNLTGDSNYVVLDALGEGNYVGCALSFDTSQQPISSETFNAPWEGDDMIFVDGEPFPPSIHGTGLEDYFGSAWGFRSEFSAPFIGTPYKENDIWTNWRTGRWSVYRFHIIDPIPFRESIRVTFEHGHANARSDDYSSTAYWYQAEPHAGFTVLPVERRLPGTRSSG
jgi:hypothetical protein